MEMVFSILNYSLLLCWKNVDVLKLMMMMMQLHHEIRLIYLSDGDVSDDDDDC